MTIFEIGEPHSRFVGWLRAKPTPHTNNGVNLSTVTGSVFGDPDCIRISYANNMQNIEKGFARINEALAKLH